MKLRMALLSGLMLAAALSASPVRAADSLQIATSNIGSSDAPNIIAAQLGYFRDAGLSVTLFDAGGGNNAVSSVVGGSAQIGLVSIFNASKPVEKGQNLKVIAMETKGFGQTLFVRSSLLKAGGVGPSSTVKAKGAFLKGKKIAVNDIGGSSGNFARQLLADAGLTGRDATILNINNPAARLAALRAGRIDAIIGTPPEPETAVVDGYGAILLNPFKDLPESGHIASTIEVVRGDFLAKNRGLLIRYETAVQRARKLIADNSQAAADAYYAYIANDSRGVLLKPAIKKMTWGDILPSFAVNPVLDAQQYANSQKFFRLSSKVTFQAFVDNSIAKAVAQ